MTDRIHSITLILKHDIRIDDAENIITAARMISGVISVKPNVSDSSQAVANARARHVLEMKLFEAFG